MLCRDTGATPCHTAGDWGGGGATVPEMCGTCEGAVFCLFAVSASNSLVGTPRVRRVFFVWNNDTYDLGKNVRHVTAGVKSSSSVTCTIKNSGNHVCPLRVTNSQAARPPAFLNFGGRARSKGVVQSRSA